MSPPSSVQKARTMVQKVEMPRHGGKSAFQAKQKGARKIQHWQEEIDRSRMNSLHNRCFHS